MKTLCLPGFHHNSCTWTHPLVITKMALWQIKHLGTWYMWYTLSFFIVYNNWLAKFCYICACIIYTYIYMIADHTFGKKVFLIDFTKLIRRSAFSGSQSWLIWKYLLGIKFFSIKQCPAELSPRIIRCPPVSHGLYPPSYQKTVKLSGFEVIQN